jgi:hypothetical protein
MCTPTPTLKEQAEEIVRYWQKQLRMLDWVFTIEIMDDPKDFDCYGSMAHSLNNQQGFLKLMNPEKIPTEWTGVRDLEVTIVHEMIHTRFIYAISPKKKKKNYHQELAIESTAKALVANKRGITPEELV